MDKNDEPQSKIKQPEWKILIDVCRICSKKVNQADMCTRLPCCSSLFHFHCLLSQESKWVKAKKGIICPRCNDPKTNDETIRGQYEKMRTTNREGWTAYTSDETHAEKTKEQFTMLLEHVRQRKARRSARKRSQKLTSYFNALEELITKIDEDHLDDSLKRWACEEEQGELYLLLKRAGISFDTLHGMQFSLYTMKRYVAKTWDELVNLGFLLPSLKKIKYADQLLLIGAYDVDIHKMRHRYGTTDKGVCMPTIQDLTLCPDVLALLGIDAHELICLGLDRNRINKFPLITLKEWVETLNLSLIHAVVLDIQTPNDLNNIPTWEFSTLANLLGLKPKQIRHYRIRSYCVFPGDLNYAKKVTKGPFSPQPLNKGGRGRKQPVRKRPMGKRPPSTGRKPFVRKASGMNPSAKPFQSERFYSGTGTMPPQRVMYPTVSQAYFHPPGAYTCTHGRPEVPMYYYDRHRTMNGYVHAYPTVHHDRSILEAEEARNKKIVTPLEASQLTYEGVPVSGEVGPT